MAQDMRVTVQNLAATAFAEVISPMSDDTTLIERVLVAASLPEAEISARVADIGADLVAEAMLAEVACRVALQDGPAEELSIQYDFGFTGSRLGYLLVLGGHGPQVEKGWDATAPAAIRQDLVDLLRELFGPPGPHGATRELSIKYDSPDTWHATVVAGMRQVVGAMSQHPSSLSDLAVRFGSDKWGGHWYTPHYEKYFEPYRELAVKVLEIGVGGYNTGNLGGGSLHMWKHYFRRGLIYGLDLFPKVGIAADRLHVLQGDQGDERSLDSIARRFGPFDIVIDDGSHFSHHVITSFNALFRHVRPGGIYVVEDLCTSYWPGWGGNADPAAPGTSMAMVKSLLDGLNHQEQMREDDYRPSTTELTVTGVHVHHNLALIEKGLNTEQAAPAWIERTGNQSSRWYLDE